MTQDAELESSSAPDVGDKVSPSAFMRELRPEHYSDTKQHDTYLLNRNELEYHLDTITSRNQTQEFEVFCRKLCELTICPNLRPPSGPEGGGDSKADSETLPVADEIMELTYAGLVNGGQERWAFAFSAKKRWTEKVRKDVQGIVETGRGFSRIIFVTSRFARGKDRARVEDELSRKHGVSVTILDRSWIVKEIIENRRFDLAFNYLRVGEEKEVEKLGPQDYSRAQQLEDIERELADPAIFERMEVQRVTEALVAAKLSRGLERPRIETDGRFDRAIRLAEKDGTFRQKLETRYERIWTSFWWFDDFELLNSEYDAFEALALKSDYAGNLEFLSNLHQLLVNCVIHGHLSSDETRLGERTEKLKNALEALASDGDRPNNALAARVGLIRIQLNQALRDQRKDFLPAIWEQFGAVLREAEGLGEFDAEGLANLIEVMGPIAGNNQNYNDLVEQLAHFIGARKSEGEGALILLRRAQKLDFSDHFDMIRWLGRAAIGLLKREYSGYLIDATQLLTLAYRSAGLLWAARASCLLAASSIVVEGEEDSELSVGIVPTVKLLAWISLELGQVPDFLTSMQFLNVFEKGLPLTEDSQRKLQEDIQELEAAFGCLILNLDVAELSRLSELPDILAALGLFTARVVLLYSLGYEEFLRDEGSLPKEPNDQKIEGEIGEFFSLLKSQPAAEQLPKKLILNGKEKEILSTTLLGMHLDIEVENNETILIAEGILGSLEAFFATAGEKEVFPHTESYRIVILQSEDRKSPDIETDELNMFSTVHWPRGLSFLEIERQREIKEFLIVVAGHVMAAAFITKEGEAFLESLFADEAVHHRITMIAVSPNSYSRLMSRSFSQISNWQDAIRRSYPISEQRPTVQTRALGTGKEPAAHLHADDQTFKIRTHKELSIQSVVDVHAWNRGKWKGCGYAILAPERPPVMALLFEDAEAARAIFERWRTRFGTADKGEEIAVSVITHLPGLNPHHYYVQIASKNPEPGENEEGQHTLVATRSMTMEPENSQNLEMFLTQFRRFDAYYLVPAVVTSTALSSSNFFFDLAILKRELVVKRACEVKEHDLEAVALHYRGIKVGG